MPRRIASFALLLVALAAYPAAMPASDQVDGVLLSDHAASLQMIDIVAPQSDHNTVSVGIDTATACFRITVDGKTAEIPTIGATGPIVQINYYGGAGGADAVTVDGANMVATLFGGSNTLTATAGAVVTVSLFGDHNVVDAPSGTVNYNTWGGTHDIFTGHCTRGYPDAPYQATSLPGVFITFPSIVNVVSPVGQGNVVSITRDSVAQTTTVTENSGSVTLALPSYIGFNYYGSWNGGDMVTGTAANAVLLYGSGNHATLTGSIGGVTLLGSGNTISNSPAGGSVIEFGSNETVTGMATAVYGQAPEIATVYTGGTGPAPTVATPASATPSPVTGSSTVLSVLGADAGGEAGLTYTWTVTSAQGASFSINGTQAAKTTTAIFSMPGSYTFEVIIRNPQNLVVTSSVTVVVGLSSIALTPSHASVPANGSQQFSAIANDASGGALAVQPHFTWTVSSGGTISASGLFTAHGDAGGPFTITATSAGTQATSSVTVTEGSATGGSATGTGTSTGSTSAVGTSAGSGSGSSAGSASGTATAGATPPAAGGSGGGACGLGGSLAIAAMGLLLCLRWGAGRASLPPAGTPPTHGSGR